MGNQFLKLGIVLTAILFALGIGYRNRLFREEKAAVEIAHREALAAERAATAANEAKSAFLSNVSHELRTPLTAIIGFTKLNKKSLAGRIRPGLKEEDAQAQKATQKLDENLDVVASESERLLNLINDLLDLAKIEAGKVEWKMVEVQAKSLIERSLNATAALFEQKPSLELVRQLPEDLPAVTADQDRIIQVLINLISNAVKFTEEGQITIGVKLDNKSAVPDGTADLLFFVKDTGSGIPDDQIDRVFDRFKQVDDHQSGKPKGTGLGLPICKEIVEHHGGQIWVASTLGKGSTFFFSLPVKR